MTLSTTQQQVEFSQNARAQFSLALLFSVARERRMLAKLDDQQLQDIGITRSQALSEAKKPLWNVPQTRS